MEVFFVKTLKWFTGGMSLLLLAGLTLPTPSLAYRPDSLDTYFLEPLTVTGRTPLPGLEHQGLDGRPVDRALLELGIQPVRRGGAHTGDISAGGFKRGDLEILIDGERHPNACPNRMDNTTTRFNSSEMESMDLMRSCCSASCGLGGLVEMKRRRPEQELSWDFDASSSLLAEDEQQFSAGLNMLGTRLNLRHMMGKGYEDGEGQSFEELYPFSAEADYQSTDLSLLHETGELSLGASLSSNRDLPFPYLLMDEIETDHYAGHIAYRGHKLYYNQTSHLMDNSLRLGMDGQALSAPTMISDAENSVVGLSGEGYHVSRFAWDLDNVIKTPMGAIANHMIPELEQYRAELHHSFDLGSRFKLSLRGGLVMDRVGDEDRVTSFNGQLFSNPSTDRTFVTHGFALQMPFQLMQTRGALLLESASSDPGLEEMWIGVQKPTGKAWWMGNPELDLELRHTLRLRAARGPVQLETAASILHDYVTPVAASLTVNGVAVPVQTYGSTRAGLFEAQLRYTSRHFNSRAIFVWGKDLDAEQPLAEIEPLTIESTLKTALPFAGSRVWLRHTWAAAQRRISPGLAELATGAWNRIDLGMAASWKNAVLELELDNVLDHAYNTHLAYARNPFSAGLLVMEPGRTLRISLSVNG
jgi:hypothetical protein